MSGPYDRCELFRTHVPAPPPSKQASVIKAQFDSVKNVAADIAAAVSANLTLPKAMPQLPPGVIIPMAKPPSVTSGSPSGQAAPIQGQAYASPGQAAPFAQVQSAAMLFSPKAPSAVPQQGQGLPLPFPKTFSKAAAAPPASSSSSSSAFGSLYSSVVAADPEFGLGEEEVEHELFLDDGSGNYLQMQEVPAPQQVELLPEGQDNMDGFFPAVPAPSLGGQMVLAPQVVVPAQLPLPQLKTKALAEPPDPHKLHEKQLKWEEVLKGIKEHADGGHATTVAKLAAMHDPDGDSDEESVPVAQPQGFNEAGVDDDATFGFDAVDAKQNAKTVQTYKTVYIARRVSLMKKLGKSTKRKNCTPAALELLFKAFHLCGDFKKSKPTHFSHVKCYVERERWLSHEEQKAYSRFFKILLQNKASTQPPGQEEGFRVSHMILMCYGIKDSVDAVIFTSEKKDPAGRRYRLTAGQVMRFGVAAWFGFLRPGEALNRGTTRTFSWRNGVPVVEYCLPFRKNRPASPYSALYKCCCDYTPYLDIPLCPVHCIDEANFRHVQKVMSQEIWRKCLRVILHSAGFPLYSRDGKMVLNLYSHRVGAAQSARDAGTDRMQIMRGGDWKVDTAEGWYEQLASVRADSVAIQWPFFKPLVYAPNTHSNTPSVSVN
eukprot:g1604.t1